MRTPWTNKTGLAKIATILATICLVSVGLCGANFFAVLGVADSSAGRGWVGTLLAVMAYLEAVGFLGSLAGLFFVGLILSVKEVKEKLGRSAEEKKRD